MGNDGSVKVWSNHNVKLRRILDQLHSAVINDHFFILDEGIFFGDSSGDFQEKTIDKFHDVGLVNNGDFLSSTQVSELKGILDQSFGVGSGGDLERFHDSWVHFVLDS